MAIKIGVIDVVIREKGANALKVAAELGFDGVEFFVPAPWEDNCWQSEAFQQEILEAARKTGAGIPSLALAYMNQYPLASPDPAVRYAVLQSVLGYIDAARAVGARQLLLAFYGHGELAFGRQRGALIEQLKAAAPAAETAGVKLGIESTLTSRQYLHILEKVGSPAVNIYLDMRNPYDWCLDTGEQIRSLGKRIGQVHFKDAGDKGGTDLGDGTNNWNDITAALKEIGYDGWAVLETPSLHGDARKDAQMNLQRARNLAARCV
jgi:sugar phosphate isomerase/epimerase